MPATPSNLLLPASLAVLVLLVGSVGFLVRVCDRVEADRHVGRSETQVRAWFGEPAQARSCLAADLHDIGVTAGLRSKLRASGLAEDRLPGTPVKELHYPRCLGGAYFWLTPQADGTWRVFSDLWVPAGVVF